MTFGQLADVAEQDRSQQSPQLRQKEERPPLHPGSDMKLGENGVALLDRIMRQLPFLLSLP